MPELEDRIVAHHVGARDFEVALRHPPRFAKDIVHVGYEADAECARAMMAENKNDAFHVLPYCLADRDEPATLFLTKNPFASSLFRPNPAYSKFYCEVHLHGKVDGVMLEGECYDVVYGHEFRVVEERAVTTRTLDGILASGEIAPGLLPDFLSLDTQGSELKILKGAERTFRDRCLALATEVEFHPMYAGQALFSEIFDFALRHGFHFVGFTYLQEISPHRLPVGARANGFVAFGDAMFFRSIESVQSIGKPAGETYLALMKLAFIALNFGHLEYAMQAMDAAEALEPDPTLRDRLAKRDCFAVLFALRRVVADLPPRMPHHERSELTAMRERALRRSQQRAASIEQSWRIEQQALLEGRRLRNLAFTNPSAGVYKLLRYILRAWLRIPYADPEELKILARESPVSAAIRSAQAEAMRPTQVEKILEEYGFAWTGEVRRRRLSAESSIAGE